MQSNGKTQDMQLRNIELIEFYYLLPESQKVQKYLKNIVEDLDQDILQQHYFLSPQLKHLQIILCLIFGGRKISQQIQKITNNKLPPNTVEKLDKIMINDFYWQNEKTPLDLFQLNFTSLKKKQVFNFVCYQIVEVLSESESALLFSEVMEKSSHLSRVKIRWQNEKGKVKSTFKRKYQNQEIQNILCRTYLTIFQYPNHYVVGMFKTEVRHTTQFQDTQSIRSISSNKPIGSGLQLRMSVKTSKITEKEQGKGWMNCCCPQ